jgi:hypothetical protein
MYYVFAYGIDFVALAFSVLAFLVARAKGPSAWARRISDCELAVADQQERHDALQVQVAKWRSRQASRERRAEEPDVEPYSTEDGAPDPVREPGRWKEWVNSGGIRYLKGKKRG